MSDLVISYVRTYVPLGVAWVLTYFAVRWGIVLDEETSAKLASGFTLLVAAIYYGIVRALERRWPWFGKLLGKAKQPEYVPTRFVRR